MTTPGLRSEARSYWVLSRSHRYSLLFALPLLVTYELLEVIAPIRSSGGVIRNGADVIITALFSWLLGPRGPLVFMALVIGVSLILSRSVGYTHGARAKICPQVMAGGSGCRRLRKLRVLEQTLENDVLAH